MKKTGMILLVLLSLAFFSNAIHAEESNPNNENSAVTSTQATQEPDFRKANWGMTKEQVKQTESDELFKETDNELIYKVILLDIKAEAHYIFKEDKLISTYYIRALTSNATWDPIYADYETWKKVLIKKYGEPTDDLQEWKKSAVRSANASIPKQVGAANLTLITKWFTDRTAIKYVWGRKSLLDYKTCLPTIYYYDRQNYNDPDEKKTDTSGF